MVNARFAYAIDTPGQAFPGVNVSPQWMPCHRPDRPSVWRKASTGSRNGRFPGWSLYRESTNASMLLPRIPSRDLVGKHP